MFFVESNTGKGALAALGAGLLAAYNSNFDGSNMGISKDPTEAELEYVKHLATHGKTYATKDEHQLRFQMFSAKHEIIKAHNQKGHKYKLGHNHMSDWTDDEFKQTLGFKSSAP